MGKRKVAASSSSESEDEKSNIEHVYSKKQINQLLLQTANLSSKNQLLQQRLKNSDLHHTLNKTLNVVNKNSLEHKRDEKSKSHSSKFIQDSFQDTGYSSSLTSVNESKKIVKRTIAEKHISVKEKKKRKEDVSSSYESSDNETGFQIKIKKEPEETTVSCANYKIPNKQLMEDTSADSESDSSDSEEEKKVINKHRIKKDSSSSESETDSDNENKNNVQVKEAMPSGTSLKKEITTSSSSDTEDERKIVKTNLKHSHKWKSRGSSSSSDSEETGKINLSRGKIKKNISNIVHRKSLENSIKRNETKLEKESSVESEIKDEKSMEIIERKIKTNYLSDSDSNTSTKSKVKVLQNIRLTPKFKDPKEKLQAKYPGIKEMNTNIDLNFSKSEDVYLFRIPKNVDPQLLINASLDLEQKCKINIGEKYNIEPTTKIPDPTLVISDSCKVIHFKSNIKMEKYIKSKKEPEVVIPEKTLLALPDKLKKRHPLFGSDFKHKITLSENVERKLDDAIANLLRKEKKAKKKKDKKRKHEQEDEKPKEEIFNLLNSHSSVKNIKKDTSEDSAFSSAESIEKVSKKNKKLRRSIIDEILKKVKSENDSDSLGNKSHKKKKKEKHKEPGAEYIPLKSIKNEIEVENIITEDGSPALSKREKKRLSIINSTLMSDTLKTPSFSPDVSGIPSESSNLSNKSKKCKRKRELNEDKAKVEKEMISEMLDSLKNNILTPKKAKKKKKHKELDN